MKASWLPTHAAAMAHELNTPLATMTLLADEISAEVKDPDLRAPTCHAEPAAGAVPGTHPQSGGPNRC